MNFRTIFMGSPDFALPSLKALHEHTQVVGVVTQPDRPSGRGRTLTPPPVKALAQELGLPVFQPASLRKPEAAQPLADLAPDVIVVAAFGQILRQHVLDLPKLGCINVHASLLPRWRGAAPINAAILHGDPQTGVTIMQMDAGLDTGPILSMQAIPIGSAETAGELSDRLADIGAQLLVETLPGYISGEIIPKPQPEDGSTYAPMLSKSDGELDFQQDAASLARKVRAFNPWPGTFTPWKGQPLKIHQAYAVDKPSGSPGNHTIVQGLPAIFCGQGTLVLQSLQPAGKKAMPGKVFLNGARDWEETT